VLVLVAGCRGLFGLDEPALRGDASPDGIALDGSIDAVDAPPPGPWGVPVVVFSAPPDYDDPTLTSDMLEMYVNRGGDIYISTRATMSDPWGTPAQVAELSSGNVETTPQVSGGGLVMLFASNRAGSSGGLDIWASTRPSRAQPWLAPSRLAELCSANDDFVGGFTADFLRVVIQRYGGGGATNLLEGTRASLIDPFSPPVPLNINTTADETGGFVSGNGLTMYMSSDRAGSLDLYVTTRPAVGADFAMPQPITELNTPAIDDDAWVSADSRHMYFASTRGGGSDIWYVTR
jgi:hypothetical protein